MAITWSSHGHHMDITPAACFASFLLAWCRGFASSSSQTIRQALLRRASWYSGTHDCDSSSCRSLASSCHYLTLIPFFFMQAPWTLMIAVSSCHYLSSIPSLTVARYPSDLRALRHHHRLPRLHASARRPPPLPPSKPKPRILPSLSKFGHV